MLIINKINVSLLEKLYVYRHILHKEIHKFLTLFIKHLNPQHGH